MQVYHRAVARAARFMRDWLLWLLLGVYALAAFVPASSVWGREVEFGELRLLGETSRITLSIVLLALLLFNSGLDIPLSQLRRLVREPQLLLTGLFANLAIPVLYIFVIAHLLRGYPHAGAGQLIVLGLALIASMPIAGSSAAWSQNASGNMALSLGLILCSTVLSPLTTPLLLHAVGFLTGGRYADGLGALANSGMSVFLTVFVLVPSLLGVSVRWLIGDRLIGKALPTLKLLNSVILLLLTYSNASVSLPGVVANPDWGFLAIAALAALGMCVLAFAAGWGLSNVLGADNGQRTAMMFGLGLNISSPGLVLAAVALAHLPGVMLPAILYTLVQHIVAGMVSILNRRYTAAAEPKPVPSSRPMVAGTLRRAAPVAAAS